MKTVFADAGYWIALFNPRDSLHSKAIGVSQAMQPQKIVTSQIVLAEFLNHYAAMGLLFRQRAVEVVNNLQESNKADDYYPRIVPRSGNKVAPEHHYS